MRKFLEKSSHDAVITVFILAQKGKMALKTPLAPGELREVQRNSGELRGIKGSLGELSGIQRN